MIAQLGGNFSSASGRPAFAKVELGVLVFVLEVNRSTSVKLKTKLTSRLLEVFGSAASGPPC